jgi:hypothetical protein
LIILISVNKPYFYWLQMILCDSVSDELEDYLVYFTPSVRGQEQDARGGRGSY